MKSIIIFILLSGFALQVSAQKKRSSWRNEWRNNIIKIDEDLLANSEGFRYVRSKGGRAFPFWNMGDYVVIDSKQIRPIRNVLDFRPVFISEIFVERDFRASAFHYSTQGPDGYGSVTKLVYQNYWERSNTEILGFKAPYREFSVTMTAEILPNTNQGMWRIESTHSYGTKLKDKGYVDFFGYIYNQQDTISVALVYDLNDSSDFIFRRDVSHFVGYHFIHQGRQVAALQLSEDVTLVPKVWLHRNIPLHVRHAVGTALPAFLEMTDWIRSRWAEVDNDD